MLGGEKEKKRRGGGERGGVTIFSRRNGKGKDKKCLGKRIRFHRSRANRGKMWEGGKGGRQKSLRSRKEGIDLGKGPGEKKKTYTR